MAPDIRRHTRRLPPWTTLLLFTALYAIILWPHVQIHAGGSDSSGYLNHARSLEALDFRAPVRDLKAYPSTEAPDFTYVPLGYRSIDDKRSLVCTYPPGLSLLILASAKLSSWDQGPALMLWSHALAGVLLTWILARQARLSPLYALFAAATLALSSVFLSNSVQLMSDVPALTWLSAAFVCALHTRRPVSSALLTGLSFGIAVLIRPTNALALPALLLALAYPWRVTAPHRCFTFLLGTLPSAALFLTLNKLELGSFLASGYGDIGYLLSPHHLPDSLLAYITGLPLCLCPLAPLAVVSLRRSTPPSPVHWVLILWILSFATFYSFYRHTGEHWYYLRFLLPAAPALIVLSLTGAKSLLSQLRSSVLRISALTAGVLLSFAILLIADRRLYVLNAGASEQAYTQACQSAKHLLPPNAFILAMQCSGALRYHTDHIIVRWDTLTPETFSKIQSAATAESRPLYALLFRHEIPEAQHHAPATWTSLATTGDIQLFELSPAQ